MIDNMNLDLNSILFTLFVMLVIYIILRLLRIVIHARIQRMIRLSHIDSDESVEIPIKICPHCGKNVSIIMESENDDDHSKLYSMVCDVNSGGCGASTGMYEEPMDAVIAWNVRSYDDE